MAITLGKYRISESPPLSYKIDRLSYDDFTKSAEDFLLEHFRGAVEIESKIEHMGIVAVSPFGFAHLLRQVLIYIFGKSLLKIEFLSKEFGLCSTLVWKTDKELPESFRNELSSIASRSGFEIDISSCDGIAKIDLDFKVEEASYLSIYANNSRRAFYAFNQVFFLEF